MDNEGREKFWNVLKNLHSNSAADVSVLMDASPWPETLCTFRPVSEHSLQQLQENKLFFSFADHYDDPFDTYFCIDVDQMVPLYEIMQKALIDGNAEFIDELRQTAVFLGQNPDTFVGTLSNQTMDFTKLKEQLLMVHNSVQRRLFSICFCEDPYNETLWLKYAGNYSGFVQIYDLECPDTFICCMLYKDDDPDDSLL